jgi:hypothetical protein
MITVIARRLQGALPNPIGVVIVAFLLAGAQPGDPATHVAGGAAGDDAAKQLILDEPATGLDVSVLAVVLHRLEQLRRALGLTVLFVSHGLNGVRRPRCADRRAREAPAPCPLGPQLAAGHVADAPPA